MAKAACWAITDAEERKRGEQIGLDTLVVHAVNDGDQEAGRPAAEANARVPRLGTTFARIKLKGIDGCPHKQWSMRFNSWLHEEPYQGSTCRQRPGRPGDSYAEQRWCMAVVSSCREMLGQVLQRAQPPPPVAIDTVGHSGGTAGDKPEEGGDDVKSSCPPCPGPHARYNGRNNGKRPREGKRIPESRPQYGSGAATRPREAGIASNRGSAMPR